MSGMKECGCIPGLQDKPGLSTATVAIEDEHLADCRGIFPRHGGLLVESSGSRAKKHPHPLAGCREAGETRSGQENGMCHLPQGKRCSL